VSRLFYHLAQIADETVWSNKEAVKQLWEQLSQDYRMQIVPLDMQLRISKLIIYNINIIAEKGNQAWHAVFNPLDMKQSMAMSEANQECLVKDPMKPFYYLYGKSISGGGYFGIATNEHEREQKERLEELISTYSDKE
jgi:hypothetical protein